MNDVKLVVIAILFSISFAAGHREEFVPAVVKKGAAHRDTDSPEFSQPKPQQQPSTSSTPTSQRQSQRQAELQTPEFLTPVHRKKYILRGDACTAPDLGKIEDSSSIDVTDFFTLTINGDAVISEFEKALSHKLWLVFRMYGVLIGNKNLRRIAFTFTVLKSRDDYESEVEKLSPTLTSTQGVYSRKAVSAIVNYKNEQQALRTATHEAVHALNHAFIGATPNWLNEGLAEYFEMMTTTAQVPEITPNFSWLDAQYRFRYTAYDFVILVNSEHIWHNGPRIETSILYANSWYWMFYLMSSNEGLNALAKLLKRERASPCSVMSAEQTHRFLSELLPYLESDFRAWEYDNLGDHRFHILHENEE